MANLKGVTIHDIGNAKLSANGEEHPIPTVTELRFEGDDESQWFSTDSLGLIVGKFTFYPAGHYHPKRLPQTIVVNRNK